MNAIVTPVGGVTSQRLNRKAKIGLGLAILFGLMSLPSVLAPTPEGEVGPPLAIIVVGSVLGLAAIVTAVWAWRTGSRLAIRLTAASVIINTVAGLPGLFADVSASIKFATAVATLLAVASVVLMFSRTSATSPGRPAPSGTA